MLERWLRVLSEGVQTLLGLAAWLLLRAQTALRRLYRPAFQNCPLGANGFHGRGDTVDKRKVQLQQLGPKCARVQRVHVSAQRWALCAIRFVARRARSTKRPGARTQHANTPTQTMTLPPRHNHKPTYTRNPKLQSQTKQE